MTFLALWPRPSQPLHLYQAPRAQSRGVEHPVPPFNCPGLEVIYHGTIVTVIVFVNTKQRYPCSDLTCPHSNNNNRSVTKHGESCDYLALSARENLILVAQAPVGAMQLTQKGGSFITLGDNKHPMSRFKRQPFRQSTEAGNLTHASRDK